MLNMIWRHVPTKDVHVLLKYDKKLTKKNPATERCGTLCHALWMVHAALKFMETT